MLNSRPSEELTKGAIDLVFNFIGWNSSRWDQSRQPYITLANPADLESWFWNNLQPGLTATEEDLAAAKGLREVLYRLSRAHIAGEPFMEDDCSFVNEWAAKPGRLPVLAETGIAWECPSITAALAHIAFLGVHLLGETKHGHLRKCGMCEFLFIDPTGNGHRRWCFKSLCGNRSKVNAFNQRRRVDKEKPDD